MTIKRSTTHLTGANLPFIESLYEQWRRDPDSVDPSWIAVFREQMEGADDPRPGFKPRSIFAAAPEAGARGERAPAGLEESSVFINRLNGTEVHAPGRTSGFAAQVESLVRAYRLHGHAAARIDPLRARDLVDAPELDPARHGFVASDLETEVRLESLFGGEPATLGRIIERLKELYCGPIAIEYQHITDVEERAWIRGAVEGEGYADPGAPRETYQGLVDADAFETFLHKKYVGAKRFSLTGGDSLIPMIRAMLCEAGELGVEEVVIGMAHRGRLNVLHNVMGKTAAAMFSEFEKTKTPEKYIGSSDVKYHMGYSSEFAIEGGRSIHLSLSFNPSHLEFVNPIVCGRVRAKQARLDAEDARRRVMPLLLHGDAAFAGQGVVAEGFNMAELPGYDVGGTYHVVINNQIGFTTLPEEGRSTRYATDIAKMVEIPILHVNGDDPEACVRAALFAVRWRQRFGKDVVLDLMCYRRYGHNEGDEPRFTQPVMYSIIDGLSHVREAYGRDLIERGAMDAGPGRARCGRSAWMSYGPRL